MRAPDATRSADFAAGMGFALVTAVGWGLNWPVPKYLLTEVAAAVDNVRIGMSAFDTGYTTLKTIVIDLGAEIPSMAGWQLPLRTPKSGPGGHMGLPDKKARPAVVVFQQGTDRVTNGDGSSKTLRPATLQPKA